MAETSGVYTQRARPALGGDSISHYHGGAATLGCLVRDRADPQRVYILCDYSGLAGGAPDARVGDPVVQPGRVDGGDPAVDVMGGIARWAAVRASPRAAADNVSAMLAEVNDLADVSPHIRGRGFLKGVRAASPGTRVYAVGRTSGQMRGTVVRVDAHTTVAWPRDQVVGPVQGTGDGYGNVAIPFEGLIECTPMLLAGDSGAVLVDGDNYALGLGFAGSDEASMFLPMQRVLDALNVDLVTEEVWRSLTQPAVQPAPPPAAPTAAAAPTADVYISYHEVNRAWVLGELMPWLESAGLTVLVDVRDFDIAVPQLENISRAIESSRHTLAILTAEYVLWEWDQLEALEARTSDPAARRRKLVPLKLGPCALPASMVGIGLAYADLTDEFASKYALPNLLKALGATRPATAPAPTTSGGVSHAAEAPGMGARPALDARSVLGGPSQPAPVPAPAAYARELVAIAEKLQQGRLVLFIGADLPESATGLPGRSALAEGLAARAGLAAGQRLAAVAQQVMQAGQRFEFTDFIRNALDLTGKTPQAFHQALARLIQRYRPETIFTVAYDAMLETALRQAGVAADVVVRESQLSFVRGDRPALYKLYGDCDQVDTLVVTEQDQNALLRGRVKAELVDELRRAFRRSTLLFLGYDLADPVVAALFDEVAGGSFQAPAYAAWPGLPEPQRTSLKSNRNLTVLDLDPAALIEALLA